MEKGSSFHLYKDIAERTDGDVYIGVVGPVRTGKSTFIARFMEELPTVERLAAVDNDPNAMIFWNADLGIQADAGAFLDALEKELSGT